MELSSETSLPSEDSFPGFVRETEVCPANGVSPMPMKRGAWGEEEDRVLLQHVASGGERDWNCIKERYGLHRSGKSCRLRYRNHLRPNLKKEPFSEAEECLMMGLQRRHGNKWALIAEQMPGRTDNEVKNAWHTKRRQEVRELRKAQEYEADVRRGVRLARTASSGPTVIDGATRATCPGGKIRTVQTKGTQVDAKRAPLGALEIDRKVLQDLICAEQPELPTDRRGAKRGAGNAVLGDPVLFPGQAVSDGSYPAMWSPFIWCTGHPIGELCPHHPPPLVTPTGFARGNEVPAGAQSPAPPVTPTTFPRGERISAEAFPSERPSPVPFPMIVPAVDSRRPVACRHVAGLESGASGVTDVSGGPVSVGAVTLASSAVQANMENSTSNGARPATSTRSIAHSDPPVSGAIAPTRKRHVAPLRLNIPPDVTMEDAIWADHLFVSPIGPFGALSPVGGSLPGGFFGREASPRVPSPVMFWGEVGSGGVEGSLTSFSINFPLEDLTPFTGTPTHLQKWPGTFPGSSSRPETHDADGRSDAPDEFSR